MKTDIKKHIKVLAEENEQLPKVVEEAAKNIFKAELHLRSVVDLEFKKMGECLNYDDNGLLLKENWLEYHTDYESQESAAESMIKDIALEIWEIRKIQAEDSMKELGWKGDN